MTGNVILWWKAFEPRRLCNGYFIEPTVFSDATADMRISQEEILVLSQQLFQQVHSKRQFVPTVSATGCPQQSIHKCEPRLPRHERAVHRHLLCNASTIGPKSIFLWRNEATGNGHREAGTRSWISFLNGSQFMDFSGKLQRAQIDAVESASNKPNRNFTVLFYPED